MSDTVIRIDNVSKMYRLGEVGTGSLAHDLNRWWYQIRGKEDPYSLVAEANDRSSKGAGEHVWALKDVSFDVKRGEVLGIIGRNGAGKSTLLKILSRVTAPTRGEVKVKGRIASLLEVGTGFHPDLTGRDNVYLNGAILGMRKTEIDSKFDEIVDFSGCERYIDTPVKRYSSGMQVRLAFAVAAHLEPEILIIDEVLAVGDAEFQKKCLGKMRDVSSHGRTVLFVSHNMAALNNLCSRAVMLRNGAKIADGPARAIVAQYLAGEGSSPGEVRWEGVEGVPGNERVKLRAARVVVGSKVTGDVATDQECNIEIDYESLVPDLPISPSIHLLDKLGTEVLATANFPSANLIEDDWFGRAFPVGRFRSVCTIPANFLNEGRYSIRVALCTNTSHIELLTQEVLSFDTYDTGEMRKEFVGGWIGVVRPKLAWQTSMLEEAPLAV